MGSGPRKLYSLGKIAALLGVHRKTLTYWVRGGKLPASRTPGGHYRVADDDFRRFVQAHGLRVLGGEEFAPDTGRRVVLAIDDDRSLLTLLEYLFRENPEFEFHGVDNGYLGLIEAGRLEPAVIFLDLLMPGLDGWELLASLSSSGSRLLSRIVILSAVLNAESDRRLQKIGIKWRIAKPFDYRRLVDVARDVSQAAAMVAAGVGGVEADGPEGA
ncbi:MAG: response regulator [Planctomycetes bacterium]|nr:response regulator [Planctomycetota bacterium]